MFQNSFPVLSMVTKHLSKVLTVPTPCARSTQNTRNLKNTSDKARCRRRDLVGELCWDMTLYTPQNRFLGSQTGIGVPVAQAFNTK